MRLSNLANDLTTSGLSSADLSSTLVHLSSLPVSASVFWTRFTVGFLLGSGTLFAGLYAWLDGAQVTENRAKFDAMDATEKRELIRKWEQFQALPEAEQQRWRQFHQSLQDHPDSKDLKEVLDSYTGWIVTVPNLTRVKIAEADLDQQIQMIRKERIEQNLRNAGTDEKTRLSIKDAQTLHMWALSLGMRRLRSPDPADLDQLQQALSPEPREMMAQFAAGNIGVSEDVGDVRRQLVMNWLDVIWRRPPNDQQLQETFNNLTAQQKQELMETDGTPNSVRRKLTDFYREQLGIGWRFNRRGPAENTPSSERPENSAEGQGDQ